jgi:hypothetical protein
MPPSRVRWLKDKIRGLKRDLEAAEWQDVHPDEIERLKREIEMEEMRLLLGETLDIPW